ncbi:MAG TPA: hypothetical protein PKK56_00475 [archaeon]|nr:hypothetical protein [archaeon]
MKPKKYIKKIGKEREIKSYRETKKPDTNKTFGKINTILEKCKEPKIQRFIEKEIEERIIKKYGDLSNYIVLDTKEKKLAAINLFIYKYGEQYIQEHNIKKIKKSDIKEIIEYAFQEFEEYINTAKKNYKQ